VAVGASAAQAIIVVLAVLAVAVLADFTLEAHPTWQLLEQQILAAVVEAAGLTTAATQQREVPAA
tara:strand:- start:827 stop:1021 length:195 start_codon:yes stop_codon:yes gene_type:complete